MKKKIIIALAVVLMLAVGCIVERGIMRPEMVSVENIKTEYEKNRECYETIAYYLVDNNIFAHIKGDFTDTETYGVPVVNEASFAKFKAAVNIVMGEKITEIVSAGDSVELSFESKSGGISTLSGRIIYGAEKKDAIKIADGWYMIVK